MAEIKRYSQRVSLSTESPNAPASPEAFSAGGRAITDIGESLGKVAEHFTAAQELQQKTEATNIAQQKLQQIRLEAAADPDPKNTPTYIKRIEDVRKDTSQVFTLRNAKSAFDSEFNTMANSTHFELKKNEREKIVTRLMSAADESVSINRTNFINADNEATRAIAFQGAIKEIDNLYAAGAIMADDATNQKQAIEKDFNESALKYDAQNKPDFALAELEKGDKGFYKKMPVELRAEGIEIAKLMIKKNKNDAIEKIKEEQFVNGQELTKQTLAGEFKDLNELERKRAKGAANMPGGITAETFASNYRLITESVKATTPAEKIDALEDLSEKLLSVATVDKKGNAKKIKGWWATPSFERISGFRDSATNAYLKGAISKEKFQKYMVMSDKVFQKGIEKESNVYKYFKDYAATHTPEERKKILAFTGSKLMDFMVDNDINESVAPEITRSIMKALIEDRDPKTAILKDVPNAVLTAAGLNRITSEKTEVASESTVKASERQWKVGDPYTNSEGQKYIVTGFYPDGEPNFDLVPE